MFDSFWAFFVRGSEPTGRNPVDITSRSGGLHTLTFTARILTLHSRFSPPLPLISGGSFTLNCIAVSLVQSVILVHILSLARPAEFGRSELRDGHRGPLAPL
jgi:hypothetical protein